MGRKLGISVGFSGYYDILFLGYPGPTPYRSAKGPRMPLGTLVLPGGMANAISTAMAVRRPTDSSAPRLRFGGVFIVVVGGSGR